MAGTEVDSSMAHSRRRWLNILLLVCGLTGLTGMIVAAFKLRGAASILLVALLGWQGFWWLVRLVVTIIIRRQEPIFTLGQIVWVGLTAPLPVLVAIALGHGRVSAWVQAEEKPEPNGDTAGPRETSPAAQAGCPADSPTG